MSTDIYTCIFLYKVNSLELEFKLPWTFPFPPPPFFINILFFYSFDIYNEFKINKMAILGGGFGG